MMVRSSIETLKQIKWSPSQSHSELLTKLGVDHGFGGVAAPCPEDLLSLRQIHSAKVLESTPSMRVGDPMQPEGDGIWSRDSAVAVRTADCLPVLFSNNDGRLVAAAHAGWRGLTSGVLKEAIEVFGDPQNITAAVGPAIGREAFEVGFEVVEALLGSGAAVDALSLAVSKGRGDRWHVDLAVAAVLQCLELGLKPQNLEVIQGCTVKEPGKWHSYRREGKGCGSNWSWIKPKAARIAL